MKVQRVSRELMQAGTLFLSLSISLGVAAPVMAQQASTSRAVVQPLPGPESQALNTALGRLGRNPKDVNALIDAGNAALAMGDVDAAVGFFANADQIQPNSPRVRAGLAAALVQNGNPYDAIPLFTEAEGAGGMDPRLNSDRGLAYDLVGDNASAQKYYRLALTAGGGDEVIRRLALSQAISGNREAMESTLLPLLQRADKPAYRTRAFGLAILGKPDEAVSIAYQSMPQDLASGIAPYLRYMPRLTKAQQAAAATFGHFPRAADIGRDDPRALRFAPPVHVATAEAALVPKGEPLGKVAKVATDKGKGAADKSTPAKGPVPEKAKSGNDKPQLAVATKAVVPAPRAALPEVKPTRVETVAPMLVKPPVIVPPPPSLPPASSRPELAVLEKPAIAAPAPIKPAEQMGKVEVVAKPVEVPKPASFADVFGDIGTPTAVAVPASGAVDIRKIVAAKPKAEGKAEAKPANPSRIWVQVGVGRAKASLQADWKALVKDVPELLRGKSAATTEWGKTKRLLAGPIESESAAKALVTKLKKAKIDSFVWTSPTGQVVDPL